VVLLLLFVVLYSDLQNKKGTILESTCDYIRKLKKNEEALKRKEEQMEQLQTRNRQLMLQLHVSTQTALLNLSK